MTKPLFWEDPYLKEAKAKIIKIDGNSVILDSTIFYPRGGGQVGDTGEIAGSRVKDTIKDKESGEVIHILEGNPEWTEGQEVELKLDWDKRYKTMKLHSAAHIVYYIMGAVFGESCKIASSGIVDDRKDRQDYLWEGEFPKEKLEIVTDRANKLIEKNVPIEMKEDNGKRTWIMEPFPPMPCGGTHVKNSGEIGKVKVSKGKKPGKGKIRINIEFA